MKSYIDVSFTLEEDLSNWSEKDKDIIVNNIDKIKKVFINEFYHKYKDYKNNIKDLNVVITFEERE